MNRGVGVMWVGLMVMGAVVTYAMKDSAGRAADRVHKLRAEIATEKEALNLLKAEWGVLDQPARLQELVARYGDYLKLQPIDVRQIATIDQVPEKPPVDASAVDGMRTSSIAPAASSAPAAVPPAAPAATAAPALVSPAAPIAGANAATRIAGPAPVAPRRAVPPPAAAPAAAPDDDEDATPYPTSIPEAGGVQ